MTMLKAGQRLKSAVCAAEIMVIRAPAGAAVELCCGGVAMLGSGASSAVGLDPHFAQGTLVGKRYVDAREQFELLCTRGGDGGLSIDGELLAVKIAKALPSSD